jgi:DNA-binding GntR family transcriptional regulator
MDDHSVSEGRRPKRRDAVRHGATVVHIVDSLRRDILERRLAPGARLIEAEMTRRFSVSRGPVREALRRLAAEGLIELAAHRGAIARRLSARDIRELFEIRIELEALAARQAAAAARGDAKRRRRFEVKSAPISSDLPRSVGDYFGENAAFHAAVYELGGNAQLAALAERLQLPLIMGQVGDALNGQALSASVCEHRAIAGAIMAGDEDAAAAAMRAHLERAARLALAQAEKREKSPSK